jgi:hypothetical protein
MDGGSTIFVFIHSVLCACLIGGIYSIVVFFLLNCLSFRAGEGFTLPSKFYLEWNRDKSMVWKGWRHLCLFLGTTEWVCLYSTFDQYKLFISFYCMHCLFSFYTLGFVDFIFHFVDEPFIYHEYPVCHYILRPDG